MAGANKNAEYVERLRRRNREWIYQYLLAHPCVECGEGDPVVLEFDHVGDTKNAKVTDLLKNASIARIEKEIALCQVLCANCHRRVTAVRGGWYGAMRQSGIDPGPEIE